jgi:hypothetical protein
MQTKRTTLVHIAEATSRPQTRNAPHAISPPTRQTNSSNSKSPNIKFFYGNSTFVTPSISQFPTWIVLPSIVMVITMATLIVHKKRFKVFSKGEIKIALVKNI